MLHQHFNHHISLFQNVNDVETNIRKGFFSYAKKWHLTHLTVEPLVLLDGCSLVAAHQFPLVLFNQVVKAVILLAPKLLLAPLSALENNGRQFNVLPVLGATTCRHG